MKNKSIHHWITILVCCGLAASSIGICANSVGVFFTSASEDLGVGRGAFALHATISSIITGLFCPMGMKLIKRYNFRVMISLGIILASGSTILMAFGHHIWIYYLLGAIRGAGCSFFALAVITMIIGNWFEQKHGFAVGFTLCFSGLSGAIFSPLFNNLIRIHGWRTTYIIMGICVLVLALPGTLFILKLDPSMNNLLPYGGSKNRSVVPAPMQNHSTKPVFSLWLFILVSMFTMLCSAITGIAQHFPGYSESMGCEATLGATMISAAMIGNIIFKLLLGIISDRIGPVNACKCMVVVNLISLTALSIIPPAGNDKLMLIIAFLYGSVYSVGAVGVPLITRHVFGTESYAYVFSYISIFMSIGSASSLTIIGLLYDHFSSYRIAILGGILLVPSI